MEYQFRTATAEPRNQLRDRATGTNPSTPVGTPDPSQDKIYGVICKTLRTFPDAFTAVRDAIRAFVSQQDPTLLKPVQS